MRTWTKATARAQAAREIKVTREGNGYGVTSYNPVTGVAWTLEGFRKRATANIARNAAREHRADGLINLG